MSKQWLYAVIGGLLVAALLLARAFWNTPIMVHDVGGRRITPVGRWKVRMMVLLAGVGSVWIFWFRLDRPREPVGPITKLKIPTCCGMAEVTIYRPATLGSEALPVYVNLHGGGWILGYRWPDFALCRYLANHANCIVVNVDYVVAPHFSFPAPVYQCYDIARWVHQHAAELDVNPARIAIGGGSAGANLAAGVVQIALARKEFDFSSLTLIVPPLDMSPDAAQKNFLPEQKQMLTPESMDFSVDCYLPVFADRFDPLASPQLAQKLDGWPPTLIVTAEFDYVRPDGEAFWHKLRRAGVDVTYRMFPGVDHSFTHFGAPREIALEAWDLVADRLKQGFAAKVAAPGMMARVAGA